MASFRELIALEDSWWKTFLHTKPMVCFVTALPSKTNLNIIRMVLGFGKIIYDLMNSSLISDRSGGRIIMDDANVPVSDQVNLDERSNYN